ncbi:hypothetical protein [Nocardioides sp. LML1-1-1.1]|uniref:hypothetical protein n=1 Tax=Nocardioides sp. LML1-1-1.1 TaxID=3135248 RepID=UPI003444509E
MVTDIDGALAHFSADGYPVTSVVHARCSCGGAAFRLRVDDEEGCAERTCVACGAVVLMLDSAEYADEADLEPAECPCGGEVFEVAVGFADHADGEVRWVYLGLRCTTDGNLGCYADWKIDYLPTAHLRTAV